MTREIERPSDPLARQREAYRQNLKEYALAVRADIDAIIEAVERGREIDDGALATYRRGIEILGSALSTYARTRHVTGNGVRG